MSPTHLTGLDADTILQSVCNSQRGGHGPTEKD